MFNCLMDSFCKKVLAKNSRINISRLENTIWQYKCLIDQTKFAVSPSGSSVLEDRENSSDREVLVSRGVVLP